ncbi:glutamine synthetase family protein [Acidisoma cladoniae]|uniref:glutamine synthetase family protein n=1 Tax=Acidisoma cladoniae TaxID=3040935 RepID=UPI0025515A29|nr:glutamine synthetase family protein [Acidisoma sp. PAMC 29798]
MASKTKSFVHDNGLWTDDQHRQAAEIVDRLETDKIKFVRIGWGDQHGIVRGKTVSIAEFKSSLVSGKDFQLVTTLFDTTNHPIVPPFGGENDLNVPEMIGLPDGVLVPDPGTFRKLPWVEDTAWILSDAYLRSGKPCPFSTRQILRHQLGKLAEDGYEMKVGLEFEFYVFKMENPNLSPEASGYPPAAPLVSMLSHGYQYLTENRGDEVEPLMRLLHDTLVDLGLPIATIEDEWGPGQCEITFAPLGAMEAADMALLFRTAVKQICRRNGYHASFMAQPQVPNVFPSGWHMHQSLIRLSDGANAFARDEGESGDPLTEIGMHYVGGLLAHADATSILTTPTINGYKRQRPDGFAPFKAAWDYENRGAMVRVIGGPGDDASRIENRIGEPTANPYLYVASQIIAGRDGMNMRRDPGPSARAAYLSDRPLLPNSLMTAIEGFRGSTLMKAELGETFWNYFLKLKSFEVQRFLAAVTDWEQQEYFEVY